MNHIWRKIEDRQQSGAFNMAADQYLLEHFSSGNPPQLRLYTWSPLTLSLGRNEFLKTPLEEHLDLEKCRQQNIEITRRVTGGQAVLHGKDLTYSVVAEVGIAPFSEGVLENYQRLSDVFLLFFQKLGLNPHLKTSAPSRSKKKSHVCFATPAAFEILIDDKKIMGNAQRVRMLPKKSNEKSSESLGSLSKSIRKRVFLQHGSLAVTDSIPILASIFRETSEAQLHQQTTSLESLGILKHHSLDSLKRQLCAAFQEVFEIHWNSIPWSPTEIHCITKHQQKLES